MRNWKKPVAAGLLAVTMIFSLSACESFEDWQARKNQEMGLPTGTEVSEEQNPRQSPEQNPGQNSGQVPEQNPEQNPGQAPGQVPGQAPGQVPDSSQDTEDDWNEILDYLAALEYEGEPFIYINENVPYFTEEEFTFTEAFELYSELNEMGRTQYAFASLDESLMPEDDEERGDISSVKPTGWVQAKYDSISNGGWLYNRCHLIAWSLAGENANEKNLMTGTRYFNVEGMLPFEMQALKYVDENPENHLLYRATPVYYEDDLLAKGLLLEAWSIEDDGELAFCVFLYNVQPGVSIDYATGTSTLE